MSLCEAPKKLKAKKLARSVSPCNGVHMLGIIEGVSYRLNHKESIKPSILKKY